MKLSFPMGDCSPAYLSVLFDISHSLETWKRLLNFNQVITKQDEKATTERVHMAVVVGSSFVGKCAHSTICFPCILYDMTQANFHLIVTVYAIAQSLRWYNLRRLALKYISLLEYISIPKGICGNIDYK